MSYQFSYQCSECNKEYAISSELMVCPECQKHQKENEPLRGILEVKINGPQLQSFNFEITDLLPVEKKYLPAIPVGNTPLWQPENIRKEMGFPELYIKDDGLNPTGSLKDRASFLVAGFAKTQNIKEIVLASTGNAGSSMAGVGAAAGIKITLFLPHTAPKAKIVQALQFGANLILVKGNYDKAYDLSMAYSKKFGGLSRNTGYNPLTIEGKKTVSMEICKNLKRAPDNVFVSVGDGVILSGVYKGFRDLVSLGLINKVPKIYAIQAQGSDALTRAYESSGQFTPQPSKTVADSISVDIPRNGYHALKNLQTYGGTPIRVSDQEILEAQKWLASRSGLFSEPAGSTALAGFLKTHKQLNPKETTVILSTGNGLKDTESALRLVEFPKRAIESLEDI